MAEHDSHAVQHRRQFVAHVGREVVLATANCVQLASAS